MRVKECGGAYRTVRVHVHACVCVGPLWQRRESLSANMGHEKCMEVVESVCLSESCSERAEAGSCELCSTGCLDSHSFSSLLVLACSSLH